VVMVFVFFLLLFHKIFSLVISAPEWAPLTG